MKKVNIKGQNTQNFRQGDVGIFGGKDTLRMPATLNFKPVKSHILAYGEVTGHKHEVIPETEDVLISIAEANGDTFLRITGGNAIVKHEEHHKISLAPGDYRITIQREYDPVAFQRKVRD